mmetsp:Transcript_28121/g.60501  ORF Transcript_28121/g.60501 Transcript_28121/m.60501 type:complete len:256 (+) Transcript_28121:362-1129(+)
MEPGRGALPPPLLVLRAMQLRLRLAPVGGLLLVPRVSALGRSQAPHRCCGLSFSARDQRGEAREELRPHGADRRHATQLDGRAQGRGGLKVDAADDPQRGGGIQYEWHLRHRQPPLTALLHTPRHPSIHRRSPLVAREAQQLHDARLSTPQQPERVGARAARATVAAHACGRGARLGPDQPPPLHHRPHGQAAHVHVAAHPLPPGVQYDSRESPACANRGGRRRRPGRQQLLARYAHLRPHPRHWQAAHRLRRDG